MMLCMSVYAWGLVEEVERGNSQHVKAHSKRSMKGLDGVRWVWVFSNHVINFSDTGCCLRFWDSVVIMQLLLAYKNTQNLYIIIWRLPVFWFTYLSSQVCILQEGVYPKVELQDLNWHIGAHKNRLKHHFVPLKSRSDLGFILVVESWEWLELSVLLHLFYIVYLIAKLLAFDVGTDRQKVIHCKQNTKKDGE